MLIIVIVIAIIAITAIWYFSPKNDIVNTLEKHQRERDQRKGRKREQNGDSVSTRPRNSQ